MMRTFAFVLCLSMLTINFSGMASAQGLGRLMTLPGIPGNGLGSGSFLGGFPQLGNISFSKPVFEVAYLNAGRGLSASANVLHIQTGPPQEIPFDFDADVPLYGIWLGLKEKIYYGDRKKGLILRGRYLLPSDEEFQTRLYNYGFLAQQPEIRRWDCDTERWFADGALFYNYSPSLSLLAGFRYDYQNVNLTDPQFISYGGGAYITSLPDQELTFNVQNGIPYLGLTVDMGIGQNSFKVGAKGFPYVWSWVEWGMTADVGYQRYSQSSAPSRSYFFETFIEYGRPFYGNSLLSLFAEWTMFQGSRYDSDVNLAPGPGVAPNLPADMSVKRSEITVGGNIALDFSLPL